MFRIVLLAGILIAGAARAVEPGVNLFVAPAGNDAWSGKVAAPNDTKTDGPFASLERAREEIRTLKKTGAVGAGGVCVTFGAGTYALNRPLELQVQDRGEVNSPVVYRAEPGKEVRISGGKKVVNWQPVSEVAVLERLDEGARGHVMQADLKALGVTDFGPVPGGGIEVFFNDKPMQISRWPNEGFVKISSLAAPEDVDIRGTKGASVGKWNYEDDRPKRWTKENDMWVHGYWFWDWSDQRHKVKKIDVEKKTIEVEPPYHAYGYREGQWYYAFNLLAELDEPGEWYVDRQSGILYFWPPEPLEKPMVFVSVLPTLLNVKDAAHVTFEGFTFEHARSTAVSVTGGSENVISKCIVRNCGGDAMTFSGGTASGAKGCEIYGMGGGGISIDGGDRVTLTAAKLYAENNHIHHYGRWYRMYHAAISISGVGNRAAHNLIHDAPHIGIVFGGNEHVIEYNELYRVCEESNDAGAMYAGRDWTMRGNVIRYNYLHDISGFEKRGCVGVYLDDMFASADIVGNVFYKVTMAAFIGGGRDCKIENNIFVDCDPAIHVDARALGWAHDCADGWIEEAKTKGTLCKMAYDKPPYSERYPQLPNILNDEPKAPKGNLIARNICVGGKWDHVEDAARKYLKFEDNLIDVDPLFVDKDKLDFRLKEDSPAFKTGFKAIPIEKIGVLKGGD